ncbi:MAG: YdeI/OmpD-associated family protein [Devosia sp.]
MDTDIDISRMKRDIHEMPDDIREAIDRRRLGKAYRDRPTHQQNDYVGWISRSKLPATREKPLAQMLDELEKGGVYMHMVWKG